MAKKKRINTNGYVSVVSDELFPTAEFKDYEYEHVKVAKKFLEENNEVPIRETEVVHHLDGNRSNNSPENLLVLRESQHHKLHSWLNQQIIIPTPEYSIRKEEGCIRCKNCSEPINYGLIFCSMHCHSVFRSKEAITRRPDKETLSSLLEENSYVKVGQMFGVTDNAIRKWAKAYEIPNVNRVSKWSKQQWENNHKELETIE